jgi:ParB-like nuclease domain
VGAGRSADPEKVAALMESIKDIGLQEPIDVLEVEGQYYGFSGCHRYEVGPFSRLLPVIAPSTRPCFTFETWDSGPYHSCRHPNLVLVT